MLFEIHKRNKLCKVDETAGTNTADPAHEDIKQKGTQT